MKNRELFDRTIGILVKAYFEGVLEYCDCAKCAVGNIVGAYQKRFNWFKRTEWSKSVDLGQGSLLLGYSDKSNAFKTGYSLSELAIIEGAFYKGVIKVEEVDKETENFNGLMSVCDALMQIHEASETEVQEAKLLFVKS